MQLRFYHRFPAQLGGRNRFLFPESSKPYLHGEIVGVGLLIQNHFNGEEENNKMLLELMKKYNTVWGCDECQSHCPHNKSPKNTPIEFFYLNRIEKLTSEIVDAMDKKELSRRAFGWRGRNTVKRNLEKLNY